MPDQTVAQPPDTDHFADLAAELYRVANDVADLIGSGLPAPRQFMLNVQPGDGSGDDSVTAKSVDAMADVLLGVRGQVQQMGGGSYHYGTEHVRRGPLLVVVYQGVSKPWALKNDVAAAEAALAEREAEVTKMRTDVAALRAAWSQTPVDPTGLGYTRADSDDDDPTPVSPARIPLHTGSVVDGGQLITDEPEQVLRYFSFGHGHIDPATGESLRDKYVTVFAPTAEGCREAMLASRFGRQWAFEYIPHTPQANEWIPQWTEHERIEVPEPLPAPTDERDCRYLTLVNSLALLDDGDTVPGEPCPDPAFYATTFARGSEIHTRTCRAHDWSLRTVPGYVSSVALP